MYFKKTALMFAFLLAGCTSVPKSELLKTQLDGPLAQLQLDTRQLQVRLEKLTENKACDTTAQCKVIAIGSRPCGGPEGFMVYSSAHTDEKLLQFTADRFASLKREQNDKLGLVSTCQMLYEPAVSCQQSLCDVESTPPQF